VGDAKGARYLILVLAVLLGLILGGGEPGQAASPTPETILRRADLVRNPYLGTSVEIDLSVVSRKSGEKLRGSRFTLLTHRLDRTLLLMPQQEGPPGAALVADDSYWLLLPAAAKPVKLPFGQVVAGDLSHAGFLRVNLRLRYRPRLDGEESLGGVPCWRLDLEPRDDTAPFGRVRYWVAREGFRPLRLEFYSRDERLLKTARFVRYQDTSFGWRPADIEIEDAGRPEELATLTLSGLRGAPTSKLAFDLDDLAALREAGQSLAPRDGEPVGGRKLVQALLIAARGRR
jgi:hypothetical protein